MKNTIHILEKLRSLSGNEQLNFLNSSKNDILKKVLLYTYDTHKLYKIDEGKYNKAIVPNNLLTGKVKDITVRQMEEFYGLLDGLSKKRSAKDSDVFLIKSFISTFDKDIKEFLCGILFKDLRLGMNIKKFQKVWGDFCVTPEVQLAEQYNGQDFNVTYHSRKFDGKRAFIMDGVAYSRSNKPCKILPIQHIVNVLSEFNDYVFDGEILYFDSKFREDFQKVISLTSSDERLEGCDNLYYVIFDMIPKDLFKSKDVFISFEDEYELINSTLKTTDNSINYSVLNTCLPNILVARQDTTKDKLLELCSLHRWEGLMLRNGEASYEYKRTKNLLKLKQMQDTECTLLDMIAGTGRNSDRLGAFVVDYKGYQVKVGSGFSDEQREMYWRDKDKYIGKAVKVQYFGETKNQHNELSLRFPVFLAFRNTETDDEYLYL